MASLGTVDLEMLRLGIEGGGTFDERDIAGSGLKRLGVGRTLDSLASLKDRGLIGVNGDGSFRVTDAARRLLWDDAVPAEARVLRLLEIRPCTAEEASGTLGMPHGGAAGVLERLRRDRLVMASPARRGEALAKVYEILPEGAGAIGRILEGRPPGADPGDGGRREALDLIDEIASELGGSEPDAGLALRKLGLLRERLGG